jgi:hypothetical protein
MFKDIRRKNKSKKCHKKKEGHEMKKMMDCGHSENGVCVSQGEEEYDPPIPCCVICDCVLISEDQPELYGRRAKCSYNNPYGKCKSEITSSLELAFFEHQPDQEYDRYYCGCWGWD